MPLKIVAGKLKGRTLKLPQHPGIRPAAARVRKSVFEILSPLDNVKVLDLFAGTGAMGIEALSRGAQSCTFVDKDTHAIALLKENLRKLALESDTKLIKQDAVHAIQALHRQKQLFDLIFIDPPYDRDLLNPCLQALQLYPILKANGRIVSEHSPREEIELFDGLSLQDERKYGQTRISFMSLAQ